MKAIFLLVMIPVFLCACGPDSGSADDTSLIGGTPVDKPAGTEMSISVECDVDLKLTPASGIHVDWMDRERGWTVAVDDDHITLTRRKSCGDECRVTEEIILTGVDGACPSVVSARSVTEEGMTSQGTAENIVRASTGTLKIQDWNLESGILSGRLESELELTFYATLGD